MNADKMYDELYKFFADYFPDYPFTSDVMTFIREKFPKYKNVAIKRAKDISQIISEGLMNDTPVDSTSIVDILIEEKEKTKNVLGETIFEKNLYEVKTEVDKDSTGFFLSVPIEVNGEVKEHTYYVGFDADNLEEIKKFVKECEERLIEEG